MRSNFSQFLAIHVSTHHLPPNTNNQYERPTWSSFNLHNADANSHCSGININIRLKCSTNKTFIYYYVPHKNLPNSFLKYPQQRMGNHLVLIISGGSSYHPWAHRSSLPPWCPHQTPNGVFVKGNNALVMASLSLATASMLAPTCLVKTRVLQRSKGIMFKNLHIHGIISQLFSLKFTYLTSLLSVC